MTIHINRSFNTLDLTDSFGKEIKTIATKISDAIPALAADNCILFLLKLLLHKVLISLVSNGPNSKPRLKYIPSW